MKLGIIARADQTGLGYQTRDYYKHLKPDKTLLVDISKLNGNAQHYNWYPGAQISKGFPSPRLIQSFLRGLDVVLTAETPYSYELYHIARQMGVRTVEVSNYEFFMYPSHPELPHPDVIILPSVWHLDDVRAWAEPKGVEVYQLHHPVDREQFPYRERTTNKHIHLTGKPAKNDRNGTWEYLYTAQRPTITTQDEQFANQIRRKWRHSNVFTNLSTPQEIYDKGDVLVLPRRYGGNSLPLNEALSSGMPVIMPDISPNNHLLPKEWLVKAHYQASFTPRTTVDMYQTDRRALQQKIQELKGWDMETESKKANKIANTISWQALLPEYERVLYGHSK